MNARCLRAVAVGALLLPHYLPAAPKPAEAAVAIDNFTFKDAVMTVPVGARVTWTNRDDIPHTVTAEAGPPDFHSHPLDTGDRFSETFDKPGTYRYFCAIHPKMRGTVIVR